MPAKPLAIAIATKSEIRREISAVNLTRRKLCRDLARDLRSRVADKKKAEREIARLTKQMERVTTAFDRRLGILKGRL